MVDHLKSRECRRAQQQSWSQTSRGVEIENLKRAGEVGMGVEDPGPGATNEVTAGGEDSDLLSMIDRIKRQTSDSQDVRALWS